MKTLYFIMISLLFISCKGKIPKFGKKPVSTFTNEAATAGRAKHIYDRTVGADDNDKKVDLDNPSVSPGGSYTRPYQINYKPSINFPEIKVEMPKLKERKLEKPNFKPEDYNSKEAQERAIKSIMELEKRIKNQSEINVEMPNLNMPKFKKPKIKFENYNSKEFQERMVKSMMEQDKIKNQ